MLDDLSALFGVPVVEAYGMTEASHQMTCNPLPPSRDKAGVGRDRHRHRGRDPRQGQQRPATRRAGRGCDSRAQPSSTATRTTPSANEAAFTAGWFRTGDEGMLDEDGYLFLTGRLKEQINRGGEKISPLEIDEVMLRHPAIAEAVAFAIPHDKLGEEVGAAVVLSDGHELDERELKRYLSERLAPFKVPRTIVFVSEIPKGATGKIQRIGLASKLNL